MSSLALSSASLAVLFTLHAKQAKPFLIFLEVFQIEPLALEPAQAAPSSILPTVSQALSFSLEEAQSMSSLILPIVSQDGIGILF